MAAKKKDFSNVTVNRVFDAITEATAAEPVQEQEVQEGRKTYTEQEAQEFLSAMQTSGRKGVKLPRINMAFTPELYDYIKTMSRVSGTTLTEFVNKAMKQYMEEHKAQYDQAIAFRNSL